MRLVEEAAAAIADSWDAVEQFRIRTAETRRAAEESRDQVRASLRALQSLNQAVEVLRLRLEQDRD